MKETVEKLIEINKIYLPVLSHYWELEGDIEQKEPDKDCKLDKEFTLNAISIKHGSSEYIIHTFYKPISTTIDLNFYE